MSHTKSEAGSATADLAQVNARINPDLARKVRIASATLNMSLRDIATEAFTQWLEKNAPAILHT
jgi:hypothetical protein